MKWDDVTGNDTIADADKSVFNVHVFYVEGGITLDFDHNRVPSKKVRRVDAGRRGCFAHIHDATVSHSDHRRSHRALKVTRTRPGQNG